MDRVCNDAYGVEPLVMPSIYARGTYNLKITTDTLHDNSYPRNFFDAVTGLQVFEHIVCVIARKK